ncbi:MAG: prepilin peptidase [Akkermansiaceae bacterium]|nr:prepilin peptidase [Akkermansiaceae bacterium]
MFHPPFDHCFWFIPALLIGSCIGSFLNVVIYRLPLGMSVNDPNRSFCPKCKYHFPMWLNLPVISWIWLRGKCANCKETISIRYPAVELLTGLLFAAMWWVVQQQGAPPLAVLFLWIFVSLLVAITFIDADHMIIPTALTWAGSVVGLIGAAVWPLQSNMAGYLDGRWDGLIDSAIGFAVGFFGLWGVVNLGKLAFGKRQMHFESAEAWHLEEPDNEVDPLLFIIEKEKIEWWDLFNRPSDRLLIECAEIRVDGEAQEGGCLVIREQEIELPDGSVRSIGEMKSLDGTATRVTIPREAMGFGDVHLMGMIGAFLGWGGAIYTLFAASLLALLAAIIYRVGFGRNLPFGPYLAMAAITWVLGGWKIWNWYMLYLGPLWIGPEL